MRSAISSHQVVTIVDTSLPSNLSPKHAAIFTIMKVSNYVLALRVKSVVGGPDIWECYDLCILIHAVSRAFDVPFIHNRMPVPTELEWHRI